MKKRYPEIAKVEKKQNLWANLEQKDLAFQRTIVSHNKFLKRNLEKRERTFGKMQSDMDLTKKREREIKIMYQRYEFFKAMLLKMTFETLKHSIYENYLNRVVDYSDSTFKTIKDLLAKFESLLAIKNNCMEKQKKEMSTFIEMHDDNLEFSRDRIVTLVGLKNQLSALSTRYEEVVRKSTAWDILINEIMNKCNRETDETDMTERMTNVIYQYMHERRQETFKTPQLSVDGLEIDSMEQTTSAGEEIQTNNLEKANGASKLMLLKQRFKKKNKKESSSNQRKN